MDLFAEGPKDYWSEIYRGRHIALLCHDRSWRVFLDRALQQKARFETAEEAAVWLRGRVDECAGGSR